MATNRHRESGTRRHHHSSSNNKKRRKSSGKERERGRDRDESRDESRDEPRDESRDEPRDEPRKRERKRERARDSTDDRRRRKGGTSRSSSSAPALSMNALAQLNAQNSGGGGNLFRSYERAQRDKTKEALLRDPHKEQRARARAKAKAAAAAGAAGTAGAGAAAAVTAKKRPKRYMDDNDNDNDDNNSDNGYERVEEGDRDDRRHRRRRDRRIPSGAVLEEGRSRGYRGHLRGGAASSSSNSNSLQREKEALYYTQEQRPGWSKKKKIIVFGGVGAVVLLIVIIAVAVTVSKKKSSKSAGSSGLDSISPSSIPSGAPSYLNPYTWADTTDFNLTYTDATVGGLPVMGLNTSYDDSAAANSGRPALNKDWGSYATTPARGVNLGGWLSLEPFITPSLFSGYASSLGVIDEYTLCAHLGATQCASTLEKHYATFVTEDTFAQIAAAGLDHVRIPYSYWAVAVYDDDPYVFRTSWRYLLRGIEWARKHGLRVNLDLHGLPGSQNGWNHSGRQGVIGWLNGTSGDLNAQRSLAVHDQLSRFFAQARYARVISHYGLANEPRMTFLEPAAVMNWTQVAAKLVRANGVPADRTIIVFGDGFRGLAQWQGQPNTNNLALDVHQYEIFNNEQIVYTHLEKIKYACTGWTEQTEQSMNTSTGFGPTIVAEWSQADTDCAPYVGNVGNGNRWTGTYDVGNASLNALTPRCPAQNSSCSCDGANADVSTYSRAYKQFLLTFAEAQMHSFEKGWGWWYWTWDTESAVQWSYKKGLAAGILPAKASTRSFNCDLSAIPSFSNLPETY